MSADVAVERCGGAGFVARDPSGILVVWSQQMCRMVAVDVIARDVNMVDMIAIDITLAGILFARDTRH